MSRPLYDHKIIKNVNVCLPDSMIEQIDKVASESHQSRSAIIREAVEQYCVKDR